MWLCSLPFYHIFSNSNEKWGACCLDNTGTQSTKDVSILDWFNGDEMNTLRKEMLGLIDSTDVIESRCSTCRKVEREGGISERMKWCDRDLNTNYKPQKLDFYKGTRADSQDILDTIEMFKSEGELTLTNRILDLKMRMFGNLCNLSCYMCQPKNSTTRQKDIAKLPEYIPLFDVGSPRYDKRGEAIVEYLEQVSQFSKYISSVTFTGGEPLMMDVHYMLLKQLIDSGDSKHISLHYQTNLTIDNDNYLDYCTHFKKIYFSVSIDSYGHYNEYIRKNTIQKQLQDNVKTIKQLNNVEVCINSTISILSVLRYKEFLERVKEDFGIDTMYVIPHILHKPKFLAARNLPEELKEKVIEELGEWRPNTKAIYKIVNELKQKGNPELLKQGINYCLSLDSLYKREYGLFSHWPELRKYI